MGHGFSFPDMHNALKTEHIKYGVLLLHISFIVILLGALVTNMFGFEGIVHIREGETVSHMRTTDLAIAVPCAFSTKVAAASRIT